MLKIGEFSKLSQITVKALRFYEVQGLLAPAAVDAQTGYRLYETSQLADAALIKSLRYLDFSVDEIRCIVCGGNLKDALGRKARTLAEQRHDLDLRLSIIDYLMKEKNMDYQVTVKDIPAAIVYTAEARLEHIGDIMTWIPAVGQEASELNPQLTCANPPYEFIEYLDGEYRDSDVLVRHSEAVTAFGTGNDRIAFAEIPATKVLSVLHQGAYENLGAAYTFIANYAAENGYTVAGLARECYIDGIWNKESMEDWLTEVQLPIA